MSPDRGIVLDEKLRGIINVLVEIRRIIEQNKNEKHPDLESAKELAAEAFNNLQSYHVANGYGSKKQELVDQLRLEILETMKKLGLTVSNEKKTEDDSGDEEMTENV